MSEINLEHLQCVSDFAKGALARMELRQRMAPIRESMMKQIASFPSMVPEILIDAEFETRMNLVRLEEAIVTFDTRMEKARSEMDEFVDATRRRTKSLAKWLESLQ